MVGMLTLEIMPHCFEIDGSIYEWADNMYYKKVAEKEDGEGFGQDALLHNTVRNATVKAESTLHLATLDAEHFQMSLRKIEIKKMNLQIEFL